MKILNIKENDLSIIIPYKSGHTLLHSTFIHLFKHLNIKVEMEDDPNKILNNVYIFVRNPVDRFFSSYYWLMNMKKNGQEKEKNDIKNIIKTTNANNIDAYINQYKVFLTECNDFHYIPQSSQILYNNLIIYKEEIIDKQTDLKLLYELKFGLNYKIYKIEDIDMVINKNASFIIDKKIGFENVLDGIGINMERFDFLRLYPNVVSFLFTTFYLYFKNIYKINGHHKNVDYSKKVKFTEYESVCSLTENESTFFGYNTK